LVAEVLVLEKTGRKRLNIGFVGEEGYATALCPLERGGLLLGWTHRVHPGAMKSHRNALKLFQFV
jgi:hypothetical protein